MAADSVGPGPGSSVSLLQTTAEGRPVAAGAADAVAGVPLLQQERKRVVLSAGMGKFLLKRN